MEPRDETIQDMLFEFESVIMRLRSKLAQLPVPSLRDTENERLRTLMTHYFSLQPDGCAFHVEDRVYRIWSTDGTWCLAQVEPRNGMIVGSYLVLCKTLTDCLDAAEALLEKPEVELTDAEMLAELAAMAATRKDFGLGAGLARAHAFRYEDTTRWRFKISDYEAGISGTLREVYAAVKKWVAAKQ